VPPTELIASSARRSLEVPAGAELLATLGMVGVPLSPASRSECAGDICCFKVANALLAAPSLPAFKAAPSARVSLLSFSNRQFAVGSASRCDLRKRVLGRSAIWHMQPVRRLSRWSSRPAPGRKSLCCAAGVRFSGLWP
jgi:hypothetical protein